MKDNEREKDERGEGSSSAERRRYGACAGGR
jgi:hypothetical protein